MISKNEFTYEDILTAYMQCRKHKRNTRSASQFERNFTDKLRVLLDQINNRTVEFGRYTCFAVTKPKPREIWAAPFKERVIHHLIHNEIGREFEKHYIDQTYSCIKGRGTLKCIHDAYKGLRKATHNFAHDVFYIKLDIQNFFVSINKEILWGIVKEKVDENSLLGWLVKRNLFNDITKNPKFREKEKLKLVPEYKSLLRIDYNRQGLTIGNLTSQFFSNVYMDGFDHFCKHQLKIKYYYRYADDILILLEDGTKAESVINSIDDWLKEKRNLTLNRKKCIVNRSQFGIKFLGARIFHHYVIPSKKIFYDLKISIKKFKRDIFNDLALSRLNSYLGVCTSFNTLFTRIKSLNSCEMDFIYGNNHRKVLLRKGFA